MASYQAAQTIAIAGYIIRTLGVTILFCFGLLIARIADIGPILYHATLSERAQKSHPQNVSFTREMLTAFLPPAIRFLLIYHLNYSDDYSLRQNFSPTGVLVCTSTISMLLLTLILAPQMSSVQWARLSLEILGILWGAGLCLTAGGSLVERIGDDIRPSSGTQVGTSWRQYHTGTWFLPASTPPPPHTPLYYNHPLHGPIRVAWPPHQPRVRLSEMPGMGG